MVTNSASWITSAAWAAILWLGIAPQIQAAACTVPTSHASLQAAVADAACSTINLDAGSFPGGVTIGRSLDLIGAGSTVSSLTGSVGSATLNIVGPASVNLQGLQLLTPDSMQNVISKEIGASLTMSDVSAGVGGGDLGIAGLLAYWPFENNAQDVSGNARHGTVQGTASFSAGPAGMALDLTQGQGWIDVALGVIQDQNACSLSVMVKISSLQAGDPEQSCCNGIFAEDNFPPNAMHVNLGIGESPPIVAWVVGGLSGLGARGIAPPLETWAHFVFTYNAITAGYQVFKDGELAKLGTETVYFPDDPLPLCGAGSSSTIGAWDSSGNGDMTRFFRGKIDELRLYDRVLSVSDVQTLYEHTGIVPLDELLFSNGFEQYTECGNGLLEFPEQCDDGNTANGDGCSSTCQLE